MSLIPQLNGFSIKNNNWHAEDVSLANIAQEFGTPTYVYSRKALTDAFNAYEAACLRPNGDRRARVHYAMKANSNLAILNVFAKLGAGFDIVSAGELARVLAAGGSPDKVVFSGVGKSKAEMVAALQAGVKCFNLESIPELTRLNEVAGSLGIKARISLRVNPDVDPKTHPYISTGLKGNKFGIAYDDVIATYQAAAKMPFCEIVGIDCHIGSQITEISPYLDALDRVLHLITALNGVGIKIRHLDIGGGLGISYTNETPPAITDFANTLLNHIEAKGYGHLEVLFEPGRSLVGNAGLLLTTIEYLKPGETKNFCIVDAAMNDLMRPAMYEAYHAIVSINDKSASPEVTYDIVGPICESGDWLGRDRPLKVAQGDQLAILSAGAYGFTMSSNYNTRGRAAEVMVDGSTVHLIRERESIESLFANEKILPA
ncbi:diaminopimelate decarboxylase [Polynucleobacter sp. 30F-ANTBAC]|jgi:diaminopimelate decarboxylase|uniref:diaminopimelate decarboxylase n=1 Tax=Polynucleobacter sp. 30F-ANTBAC TaxID=2689095 RepID=UPI001C0C8FE1|nr:diaminopimelate decarboxylase [Polynucleobacter sp. 30F-ANTBAC]MBU3599947.1 diaminopimelate decarboxylase [Polynucleobacter sp. 30F-ANTBAC]